MSWSTFANIRVLVGLIVALAAAGFLLSDSAPGSSAPATENPDLSRIYQYVNDEMTDSRIPGIGLAIVNSDGTVDVQGFGKDGRGHAIDPDTPFWIGSNTKSFTALSVMQLVEAGKIDLDAPVQRYLPTFQLADTGAASSITARMLLNQTSGLARADGIDYVLEERQQTISEAVASMRSLKPNRPVGEVYEYSNLNFVIAGLLVERVSGQSWQAYVQEHIFTPLDMRNSFTSLEAAKANGLTAVHRYWFGMPLETEVNHLEGMAPTGYLYSSARDMSHYLSMYLNGGVYEGRRLLSEQGINAMLTGETNDSSRLLLGRTFDFQYGRGWFVGPFGATENARWHLGDLYSFAAWMVLLPDTDQAVVVLMNASSQLEFGATDPFSRIPIGVVNILEGQRPPTGMSLSQFYVLFDALALIILVLQLWSLRRVAFGSAATPQGAFAWARHLGPLFWEFGAAGILLVSFPSVLGAGWSAVLLAMPDLARVLLAVSVLWLVTGLTRVIRLLRVGAPWKSARPTGVFSDQQGPRPAM